MPAGVRLISLCLLALIGAACGDGATRASSGFVEQACQTTPEGYTICNPSEPLPRGATPPPPPTALVASDQVLADVPIGTPAASATSRLTARLGTPDVEPWSCQREERRESLDVPLRAERLTWEDVSAYMTRRTSGETAFTGWTVTTPRQEPWKYGLRLPYGLRLQEPVDEALRKVPRARTQVQVDGADAGALVITTPDLPGLALISHEREGGAVDVVAFDPEGCR